MKALSLLLLGLTCGEGLAFDLSKAKLSSGTALYSHLDRRNLFKSSVPASFGFVAFLAQGKPSFAAAGSPPTAEELGRIKQGYKQIQYLLANFEQETTICRENGGECKRDAEPIRRGKR